MEWPDCGQYCGVLVCPINFSSLSKTGVASGKQVHGRVVIDEYYEQGQTCL